MALDSFLLNHSVDRPNRLHNIILGQSVLSTSSFPGWKIASCKSCRKRYFNIFLDDRQNDGMTDIA